MLGEAIGDLLPSAVGVALSPVPIVAVILMLGTPRARSNGPAFAAGWLGGLVVVSAVVLLVAGGADDPDGATSTVVDLLKLLFGLLLLLVAVKQWRDRPGAGEEAAMPTWMDALDRFTAGRSLLLGAALSGVNPKNLALTLAAATSIAQAGLSSGGDVVAVGVFVVIGSLTVAGPVLAYLVGGSGVRHPLDEAKQFMADNNAVIMAVVCLVLAAKLIGNGIAGLSD
jgi:threonine/homoserine/homoserine lactone efflux protein